MVDEYYRWEVLFIGRCFTATPKAALCFSDVEIKVSFLVQGGVDVLDLWSTTSECLHTEPVPMMRASS